LAIAPRHVIATTLLPVACTFGSRHGCHDVLNDDGKRSGLHASFKPHGGMWFVRDLASQEGTFVNGNRIWHERVHNERDIVSVGGTRIVFRAPWMDCVTKTSGPKPLLEFTERE